MEIHMSEALQTSPGFGRREVMLKTVGAFSLVTLAGLTKTGRAEASSTKVLTPQEEQGPYFVDGQLERSDVRTDTTTGTAQAGLPVALYLKINQITAGPTAAPLVGARVDIWQANAAGVYSDESSQGTTGTDYLRGYQITDSTGKIKFITIYPGWYNGRTPHIHMMVRIYSGTKVTYTFETQFFFTDAMTQEIYKLAPYSTRAAQQTTFNTNDRVYNFEDCTTGATSGDELQLTILKDTSTYLVAEYVMELDLTAPVPTCIGVSDGGINEG